MTENALRGNFQASPAFGYKVEQKGQAPVVVEDQANIVRMIFSLYVTSGKSFYDISRHLNRLGYKTKKGGNFEARTIKYIIQNPIYKDFLDGITQMVPRMLSTTKASGSSRKLPKFPLLYLKNYGTRQTIGSSMNIVPRTESLYLKSAIGYLVS